MAFTCLFGADSGRFTSGIYTGIRMVGRGGSKVREVAGVVVGLTGGNVEGVHIMHLSLLQIKDEMTVTNRQFSSWLLLYL